jgi:hypothetical protein
LSWFLVRLLGKQQLTQLTFFDYGDTGTVLLTHGHTGTFRL